VFIRKEKHLSVISYSSQTIGGLLRWISSIEISRKDDAGAVRHTVNTWYALAAASKFHTLPAQAAVGLFTYLAVILPIVFCLASLMQMPQEHTLLADHPLVQPR